MHLVFVNIVKYFPSLLLELLINIQIITLSIEYVLKLSFGFTIIFVLIKSLLLNKMFMTRYAKMRFDR